LLLSFIHPSRCVSTPDRSVAELFFSKPVLYIFSSPFLFIFSLPLTGEQGVLKEQIQAGKEQSAHHDGNKDFGRFSVLFIHTIEFPPASEIE